MSPEGSSGCSPSRRNHRWETVSTGNQDNHFRAGRTEETDSGLKPTLPELSAPGSIQALEAMNAGSWSPEVASPISWTEMALGSAHLPHRPILTALRRPANDSLEVFPRAGFTNILEEEGANFWLKCGCATGLRA